MYTKRYRTLDIAEVKEFLKRENTYLLDVRTDEEYEDEHLEKSVHIPLHELEERMDELDPEKEYIALCAHGMRSRAATSFLTGMGMENIYNSQEGMATWR